MSFSGIVTYCEWLGFSGVVGECVCKPLPAGGSGGFEAHPGKDLGLDSLDRLDLLADVEDTFGVRISEDQLSLVRNLDGLLKAMGVDPREIAA